MSNLLDAMDELHTARNLVRLIAMTTQSHPDEEQKAISAGCEAIEGHFEQAFALLDQPSEEVNT